MMMLLVLLVVVTLLVALGPSGTAAAGLAVSQTQTSSRPTGVLRDVFPVSGFEIAMAVLVVVILIAGGIALRRLSRPRTPARPQDASASSTADETTGGDENATTPDDR